MLSDLEGGELVWRNICACRLAITMMSARQLKNSRGMAGVYIPTKWLVVMSGSIITCCSKGET